MKFICYSKCSTCTRARKWLEKNNIQVTTRDIKDENPSFDELKNWHKLSGLDIKRFFNTSGLKYRELNLKDKLVDMTLDEKLDLLSSDGMLVKRPLLVGKDFVLLAFKEDEWEKFLL